MSTEEFVFQLAVGLAGVAIGWLARGVAYHFRWARHNRAWRRARPFLSSKTNKS
jgi:hypothetical protein